MTNTYICGPLLRMLLSNIKYKILLQFYSLLFSKQGACSSFHPAWQVVTAEFAHAYLAPPPS